MPAGARKTRARHQAAGAGERTANARDAALRRLSRAKRWLLAGTATLTGVLSVVAASAFEGKSAKSATSGTASQQAAASSTASGRAGEGSGAGEGSTLQPPAQEPQASVPPEGAASSGTGSEGPVVSGGS
jgi:hypothetical protein